MVPTVLTLSLLQFWKQIRKGRLPWVLESSIEDEGVRYVILKGSLNQVKWTLVGIYAPNNRQLPLGEELYSQSVTRGNWFFWVISIQLWIPPWTDLDPQIHLAHLFSSENLWGTCIWERFDERKTLKNETMHSVLRDIDHIQEFIWFRVQRLLIGKLKRSI